MGLYTELPGDLYDVDVIVAGGKVMFHIITPCH